MCINWFNITVRIKLENLMRATDLLLVMVIFEAR